jgi:hypothetical protein
VLTSSQSPASPSEEQKQAEGKQRQAEKAEQRKAREEQRRAKEQQGMLQEVGCDIAVLPVTALACYAVQYGSHHQLSPWLNCPEIITEALELALR